MKIKMVDIAKHLGVSKATVSLAVNGKPGVNEETRRMVLECLEEMKKNNGVIPVKENIVTVSGHPANQMIKVVIVNHGKQVVCDPELDLWSDVLTTFDSEARKLGYLYGMTYLNDSTVEAEAVIAECNMDLVAGVILFGTELDEADTELLKQIEKPLVLYDCELASGRYSSVCIDNNGAVKNALKYLHKEGASDIRYFCTGKDIYNFRVRKETFQNTKIGEDVLPKKREIIELGEKIPKITENLLDWLRENLLPQGMLFENYQVSIGALTALQKYGVRVPQEVKIVGIDEIPDYICPDMCLTQMKIPHTERAIMAMDLLDKEIRYSWTVKVNIYAETEMIVR